MFTRIWLSFILLGAPLWAQVDSSGAQAAATTVTDSGAQMLTPPPVSGENYRWDLLPKLARITCEGGLTFTSAYSDNVLGGLSTNPVSDISYSVWPTIALDETRSRLHWTLTYAPGFTFYQKTSSYNQADQSLATNFQYRLTPHVTLSLRDSFQRVVQRVQSAESG